MFSQVFFHDKFKEANTLAKVFDVDSTSTNVKYSGKPYYCVFIMDVVFVIIICLNVNRST